MSFCTPILSLWALNFFFGFVFFFKTYNNGFMTPPWNSSYVESVQFSASTSQQTAHLSDGFIWIPNTITKQTMPLPSYLTIWLKPFVLLIVQFPVPPLLWQVSPHISRDRQTGQTTTLLTALKIHVSSLKLMVSFWNQVTVILFETIA